MACPFESPPPTNATFPKTFSWLGWFLVYISQRCTKLTTTWCWLSRTCRNSGTPVFSSLVRTYNWQEGRNFWAMLIPLVADMPIVWQAISIASGARAHYFCTLCDLDIDDLNFIEPEGWPRKDPYHVQEFATLWKGASSKQYQDQIFDACGICWSALLDLPYWNPILYSVVDSMHVLDLGLFQHHCCDLVQINIKVEGGDGFVTPQPLVNKHLITGLKPLQDCVEAICSNHSHLLYALLDFHRKVLFMICLDNEIRRGESMAIVGMKWILANQIYTWVCGSLFLSQLIFKDWVQRQTLDNEKLAAFRQYGIDAMARIPSPRQILEPSLSFLHHPTWKKPPLRK